MRSQMSLRLTLLLAASLLGITFFAAWRGARAPDPLKGPRMVPWRLLMLLAAALAMLMMAHLANLAGLSTGQGR